MAWNPFQGPRSRARHNRHSSLRFRPVLDVLEDRTLLAAAITATLDLADGVLRIEGTDQPELGDAIRIVFFDGVVGLEAVNITFIDGGNVTEQETVSDDLVSSIEVHALDGPDGVVIIDFNSEPVTIPPAVVDGGDGNDNMFGGPGPNTLIGGNGVDELSGEGGDDVLIGGAEEDQLYGGDGNDSLDAGAGFDLLWGEEGNDTLDGGSEDDTLLGHAGNDSVQGGTGKDSIEGGASDDTLAGGEDADLVRGGAGNDEIRGGGGNDSLLGEGDHDRLVGDAGLDRLNGGLGFDRLEADRGGEFLSGGEDVTILVPDGDSATGTNFGGTNAVSRFLRSYQHAGATPAEVQRRARALLVSDPYGLVTRLGLGTTPAHVLALLRQWRPQTLSQSLLPRSIAAVLGPLGSGRPAIALVNAAGTYQGGQLVGGYTTFLGMVPTKLHYVVLNGFDAATGTVRFVDHDGVQKSWSHGEFLARWDFRASGTSGSFLTGSLGVKERTLFW